MKNLSKDRHDLGYSMDEAYEIEKEKHFWKTRDSKIGVESTWNNLYSDDDRHGYLMDENKEIKTLVDIGSGTGWFVNYAKKYRGFNKIYGIEPSKYAIDIAKKIYQDDGIIYINDYAEDALSNIKLTEKTLFTTFIVLSHLDDEIVSSILVNMNNIAPYGSIFYFNEMHGTDYHEPLWHCRTEEWWIKNLPDWNLTFHKNSTNFLSSDRFKGISGIKTK
jgi:SAM-dependent methyltransferase